MIQSTIICKECDTSNPAGSEACATCGAALPKPKRIFLSYAHEDEKMKEKLEKHCSTLRRVKGTILWNDRDIKASEEWAKHIDENLKKADIVLLLISDDFMASDYCYSVEMAKAMELRKEGKIKVVPIILRPVDLSGTPFMKLQALPKDAKPVSMWPNEDLAWLNIVQGLKELL